MKFAFIEVVQGSDRSKIIPIAVLSDSDAEFLKEYGKEEYEKYRVGLPIRIRVGD